MKTFDLLAFERKVSQLATELTPRQRYLCSVLIAQNPVVTEQLRSILMHALDIDEAPDPADPVYQALQALGDGRQLEVSDHRTRSAFTVLRSLGAMPDLFRSIQFVQALGALTNETIR